MRSCVGYLILTKFILLLSACTYKLELFNSTLSSELSSVITPAPASTTFITRWKTDNPTMGFGLAVPTTTTQIQLPLHPSGTYNFTADWGDGTTSEITSWNDADKLHTYSGAGTYTVTMTGNFTQLAMLDVIGSTFLADPYKLIDVVQWGNNQWQSMNAMFAGATNLLTFTATDAPNLSQAIDMSFMFYYATGFNADIGNYNTSNITNMSFMFYLTTSFNQNIASWNTSNVTNMSTMFAGAALFNQNIGGWNTSNVTDMQFMFDGASTFDQNISGWLVNPNVIDCTNFGQSSSLSAAKYTNIYKLYSVKLLNYYFS